MIVAERKPFDEIKRMVAGHRRILSSRMWHVRHHLLGWGEKEVAILASQLNLAFGKDGNGLSISEVTVERQCEREMVEELKEKAREVDVILSLGCGAGVQTIAEVFEETPVYPVLNTTFVGIPEREGVWGERCGACGDCFLDRTGGICPIVRCAKGLLNGPCGGTKRGKCEIDPEKDCAWTLIYRRLEKQGRLELMRAYYPPRNFQAVIRPGRVEALQA